MHAGNLRRTSLPWSYVFGSASRGLQGGLCDSTTHRCFVRPLVFNLLSRLCADFLSRERSPPKTEHTPFNMVPPIARETGAMGTRSTTRGSLPENSRRENTRLVRLRREHRHLLGCLR